MGGVEDPDQLIWRALADPTRRRILDLLRESPRTTGQLAVNFEVSRIAVMRHLTSLAEAGLVLNRKRGRERWHYLNALPLQRVYRRWVGVLAAGWASNLLRLESEVASRGRTVGAPESALTIDLAQELVLAAPRAEVFAALTDGVAAWWGAPYLTSKAIGLTLEGRVGGSFLEEWAGGGGRQLALVTALDPDTRLELTGPFHLGVVFGMVEFRLDDVPDGTRLAFSHRAIGDVSTEAAEAFAAGWRELLGVRLRALVERGERLGISGAVEHEGKEQAVELERDDFGAVSHDPDRGVLELEWFETTASMSDDDFKRGLERLAALAEERSVPHVLIDVTRFAHRLSPDLARWREQHIIPRYNRAGVRKFAFLVPVGAPGTVASGSEPAPEGSATFPTGYFDSRDAAYAWFSGADR